MTDKGYNPPSIKEIEALYQEADHLHARWVQKDLNTKAEVGLLMRQARESARISLRELSKLMDISASYLGDMEMARRGYTVFWAREALSAIDIELLRRKKRHGK